MLKGVLTLFFLFSFSIFSGIYFQGDDSMTKVTDDLSVFRIQFGSKMNKVQEVMKSRGTLQAGGLVETNILRYTGVIMGRIPTRSVYFLFDNNELFYSYVAVVEETSNYVLCDKKFSELSKILYKKYKSPKKSKDSYFTFQGEKLTEKQRVWYIMNIANLKKFLISLVLRPYSEAETTDSWMGALYQLDDDDPKQQKESSTIKDAASAKKIRLELSYQDVQIYNSYNEYQDKKIIEDF